MHAEFLLGAGLVLGALALAALLVQRVGLPAIPGFILLGMAARPLALDRHLVELLATLGVVLLLFFMGLEFSLGALLRDRRRIVRNGTIDLALSFPAVLAAGLLLGLGVKGALLLAAALYVSSSAIIARTSIELRRTANPETEAALGILVYEDLAIALFLALFAGFAGAGGEAGTPAAAGVALALGFVAVVVLAAHAGRRVLDRAFDVDSDDVFVLLAGGVVLLLAWGAVRTGLSEAIGAFLAGMALAETRHRERAERLFSPLQGLFAAVFFLGFGLGLDPAAFAGVWPEALVLAPLAIALKTAAGWLAGRRDGLSQRSALVLGLTLVPRGEFSVVLAGLAVAVGMPELGALIGLLVLALSLAGTVLMRFAPELARRAFPRRARTLEERGFDPRLAKFDASPRPRVEPASPPPAESQDSTSSS
ncbi:MAG TPA: cation:proton antiporter [Longimicrobiaceae bacterium]|nr:cation:proton antiporter [Longimicrobiaceae bacterium]